MQRTNKETVKAHLNVLLGQLLVDWQGNQKVINSLQYALRAVDAFDPQKTPPKRRFFNPSEEKVEK